MIDPVFVGLVAAAFVFLYSEMVRMVRFRVEKLSDPNVVGAIWGVLKEDFEDYSDFAGEYIWHSQRLYVPLFVSLVPYLIGILILFGGYAWDAIELVYFGVVMLGFAFALVGCFCLMMLSRHVIGRHKMVKFVVDRIRKYAVEREGEGTHTPRLESRVEK